MSKWKSNKKRTGAPNSRDAKVSDSNWSAPPFYVSCGLLFWVYRIPEVAGQGRAEPQRAFPRQKEKEVVNTDSCACRVQRTCSSPGLAVETEVGIGGDAPVPRTESDGAVVIETATAIELATRTEIEAGGGGGGGREREEPGDGGQN